MSDQTIGRLGRKSDNIDDRRSEFSDMEHLLMLTGIMPYPEQDAAQRKLDNLKPGEWLDPDPNRKLPISPLGLEAGVNDLDNLIEFNQAQRAIADRARFGKK